MKQDLKSTVASPVEITPQGMLENIRAMLDEMPEFPPMQPLVLTQEQFNRLSGGLDITAASATIFGCPVFIGGAWPITTVTGQEPTAARDAVLASSIL